MLQITSESNRRVDGPHRGGGSHRARIASFAARDRDRADRREIFDRAFERLARERILCRLGESIAKARRQHRPDARHVAAGDHAVEGDRSASETFDGDDLHGIDQHGARLVWQLR